MTVAQTLARGRAVAESLMVDTCTVRRRTGRTYDSGTNDYTDTYTTLYTGKCRVKPGGGFEVESGGTELVRHRWTVSLPMSATGILPDDEVSVSAATNDADLTTVTLAVVESPAGTHLTARRLVCEVAR